jgi:hypothetical protein
MFFSFFVSSLPRFDAGAQAIFTATVKEVKRLRPHARVGFYSQGINQASTVPGSAEDNRLLCVAQLFVRFVCLFFVCLFVFQTSNDTSGNILISIFFLSCDTVPTSRYFLCGCHN